jgi:HK97 family phage portal protein
MSVIRALLAPLTRRAAPTPVQSSMTLYDLFGSRSAAGVNVTPAESLSVSTVQACVALIARSLASVPLVLYRRTADGGREPAEEHPLYSILHDLSNPLQTAFEVRQLLFVGVLLYGNGYAEIEWGADGYPSALWPLAPEQVSLYTTGGREVVYRVEGDTFGQSSAVRWLPSWRVHHLRGLATAGLMGLSPLRAANAVGLAMATEEFGARFFGQGARPGYILSHPGQLSDKAFQRLQNSWNDGGGQNAHKTKIVEEGIKVEKTGVAPDEAQFLETRAFQVAEICRIFNVSPGLVGAAETQTYASAEQDMIRFRELTLGPWAKNHRAAIQRDMLTSDERRDYFVQYKLSALQATDLKTRYEAHQIALLTGFATQNEVRALEDMNPVEGGGDLWRPLNMGVTGKPEPAEPGDQPGDDASRELTPKNETVSFFEPLVADVRARLTARITNDVRQQGAKAQRNGGRLGLQEWGEEQMHDWRMAGEGMLAATLAAATLAGVDVRANVGEWVTSAYQAAVRELIANE